MAPSILLKICILIAYTALLVNGKPVKVHQDKFGSASSSAWAQVDGTSVSAIQLAGTQVAFDAGRTTLFAASNAVVTYDTLFTNVGSGFSIISGVFTAPVAGLYAFSASFLDNNGVGSYVKIYKGQGTLVGTMFSGSSISMGCNNAVLQLQVGDGVWTVLQQGDMYNTPTEIYAKFSGFLIYPTGNHATDTR